MMGMHGVVRVLRFRVWVLVAMVTARGAIAADAAPLRDRHTQLREPFVREVERIAARCEARGQADEAAAVRRVIEPRGAGALSIPILPNPSPPATADEQPEWSVALARVRREHARELFELARAAFQAGEISFCYDLVREVVEHDPDHGQARNLLGFTRYRDQWATPYAAGKLKSGQEWHARFGWTPRTHVARLEQGERLWKGQWLPADEVAKYREPWGNAWEIETEHYVVRTNVSLERGVEFADRLEKLYAIFFRLFAGFFSPRDQMAMLFDPPGRRNALGTRDPATRQPPKRFRVNFYRTRDEYLEALRPHVRFGLGDSTGMYLTNTRTAYFYVHEEMDDATVIHEATHQLFAETREHPNAAGTRGNYWVLEGIACYMESFRERDGRVELGGWETPRFKVGRDWIVKDHKYVPAEKLTRLEIRDFDTPDVHSLYAQSACLCHFLMHHDGGRHRDVLVKYLEQVYLGRAEPSTLAELLEMDFADLDRAFVKHVAAKGF
jgi:hypothetical protein